MNHERLYEFRFRDIDQDARNGVWTEIAAYLHTVLGEPQKVLDPAAGRGEFLNAIPAAERWAVDLVDYEAGVLDPGVTTVIGDVFDVELPEDYFDAVWVSNFLEHLDSQAHVARFLEKMRTHVRPGGVIAVMGPNFRYAAHEYFDMADHTVVLTHNAVAEHLYAAGFEPIRTTPRFLPYSFTGRLPPSATLTRAYLKLPPVWRLLGKQFLVIGRR